MTAPPILVPVNSPGEVSWLRPLARRAQQRGCELDVFLLPCTFATGQEAAVAQAIPGVSRVLSTPEVLRLLWKGSSRYPAGTPLLHLGGDLMYTALLSWRWGWRSWSYLWGRRWWDSALEGYFVRNDWGRQGLLRRGIAARKIEEIGDLVVEGVRDEVPLPGPVDPNCISFMPGSRERELLHLTPFLLQAAALLRQRRPELRFQLMVSPFHKPESLARLLTAPPDPPVGGIQGRLSDDASSLEAEGVRLEIIRSQHLQALSRSAMACSIPGTKTAEAGVLGVPTLTIVPLNRPEMLPFHGLTGLLHWVPGGGRLLGRLVLRQKGKIGLRAQPNQLADCALMPELIEVPTPADVRSVVSSARTEGKHSVLVRVKSGGSTRFVALPVSQS